MYDEYFYEMNISISFVYMNVYVALIKSFV